MKRTVVMLISLIILAVYGAILLRVGPQAQDFIVHYGPVVQHIAEIWGDEFFAESYLVFFTVPMANVQLDSMVESVLSNGDIIMTRRQDLSLVQPAESEWPIVIELNNNFMPNRFNLVFVDENGRRRNAHIPVRVYRRNVRRTTVESGCNRQDFLIRYDHSWNDNRPVRILEDIREFRHERTGVYTIQNDGSLWVWRNTAIPRASTSIWIMDDVQAIPYGSTPMWSRISAIDQRGTLWHWDWVDRKLRPLMDNVRWADGTMIIKNDDSLWSWGDNYYGQVGDGTREERHTPVHIMDDVREAFHIPFSHNMAITNDATLWAWGRNNVGQLGDGTTEDRDTPVPIMNNVYTIISGYGSGSLVQEDGTAWFWGGRNRPPYPQIFPGIVRNINSYNRLFRHMDSNWNRQIWGVRLCYDTYIFEQRSWRRNSFYILTPGGELWARGTNDYGSLGDGTKDYRSRPVFIMSDVISAFMGNAYVMAITSDNTLWAWGRNDRGQLGDGTTIDRHSPVMILEGINHISILYGQNIAHATDGSLWAWGPGIASGTNNIGTVIHRNSDSALNQRPFFRIGENFFANPPQ